MIQRVLFLLIAASSVAFGSTIMTPELKNEIQQREAQLRRAIDEQAFAQNVTGVVQEIRSFCGYDLTAPKFGSEWVYNHWQTFNFVAGDWYVEIGKDEVVFRAYFDESSKAISSSGTGTVEIALRFRSRLVADTGKLTLEFVGFTFERGIEWADLHPA